MTSTSSPISLRSRIISAGSWVLGGHVLSQILRLGSNLIMTRLLVPEMFGIMAVANVFYIGLGLFSDLGLQQNIIQSKRGGDPVFLNTVWTVQIIRGGLIWILALGLAAAFHFMSVAQVWLDDSVYAEPILPYVIAAITFNMVIYGFTSTKFATASRDLSLGIVTRIELISQVAGLISMVVWAFFDRSIWALVVGSYIATALKTILSHVWIPGMKNKLHWEKEAFTEIFQFGKWIFLSSITGFLLMNGDRLLLGGLVDAQVLGLYTIAFLMVNAFQMALSKFSGSVVYPALSMRYREQGSKFKSIYYKFRIWQDTAISFLVGFLVVAGDVIIEILYDDRYLAAGPMLQVLSLVLLAQRYALADQCYLAMGKPKLMTFLIVVRMIALYSFIPAGYYFYGLQGVLWGIVLSSFSSVPASLYLKAKYDLLDVKKELITLPIFLPGAALGWVVVSLFN